MKVLGLSGYFHDATAALVEDGIVLASCAEERLSLIKHDTSFPKMAIDACLQQAKIDIADVDQIVFYEETYEKFLRVLTESMHGFPRAPLRFARTISSWISYKLWVKENISRQYGISPEKISFVPHHLSHAAQGFCTSGFDEAAILVLDAAGENACTSLFIGTFKDTFSIRLLEKFDLPHSLGLFYAAFTAFCGFKVNDGECSTMALAAFGRPIYTEIIEKICRPQKDGGYELDPTYFDFQTLEKYPFTRKFREQFGEPRDPSAGLPFAIYAQDRADIDSKSQYYADIAASTQHVLEQRILALCRKIKTTTHAKNLVIVGGVALNCVANRKILLSSGFEKVFVPPDPGDGGGAMGAALYTYFSSINKPKVPLKVQPYLGKSYDVERDIKTLGNFSLEESRRFFKHAQTFSRIETRRCATSSSLSDELCESLANGKSVGFFHGRFESGPRALGHRSILLDPRNVDLHRKLSRTVKTRENFRPYGFSVTDSDANKVLQLDQNADCLSAWMQTSAEIHPSHLDQVAGAVHIDHTSRPQVVSRTDDSVFYDLLSKFGQAQGLAALTNTSFNAAGAPLVSSPLEAFSLFLRTPLDILVLDQTIIAKRDL